MHMIVSVARTALLRGWDLLERERYLFAVGLGRTVCLLASSDTSYKKSKGFARDVVDDSALKG